MKKTEGDKRLSKSLNLRLTPDIYDWIRSVAEKHGCTMSQATRLILQNDCDPGCDESLADAQPNEQLIHVAESVRAKCHTITRDFHLIVSHFRKGVLQDGTTTEKGASAALNELYSLALLFRDQLKRLNDAYRQWTVYQTNDTRTPEETISLSQQLPSKKPPSTVVDVMIKIQSRIQNNFMQYITIMGITDRPIAYSTSQKGVQYANVVVGVLSHDGQCTKYIVVKERDATLDQIMKGCLVVVTGELSVDYDKRQLVIRADNIKMPQLG